MDKLKLTKDASPIDFLKVILQTTRLCEHFSCQRLIFYVSRITLSHIWNITVV